MLNMRERRNVLLKRLSGLSLLRLLGKVILGVLTLQVLTAAVLLVIAALGKRRKHEVSFPHQPFEEVQVGENVLQLYAYGRDLYDAMLEAIDAAKESIYLETYIWKDDAVGQEFRTHLARKAAEGVAVYSAELARQMFALFAEDTAEKFELTMEQWKSRPWYNKVSERILAPLRFMM